MKSHLGFLIALCIMGLGSSANASSSGRYPIARTTTWTTVGGGNCIGVWVALPDTLPAMTQGAEPYLEFAAMGGGQAEIVTFFAYRPVQALASPADVYSLPLLASWDITPMDATDGEGGYVRLHVPPAALLWQSSDWPVVIVYSEGLSLVDMLGGLNGGVLVCP